MIRMLSNVQGSTYEEKLKKAGLTTLKDRRERGDLVETFKTLNGLNNVDKAAWFELSEERIRPSTRSNTTICDNGEGEMRVSLLREQAQTDLRNNSFRFCAARAWSELPDEVRDVKSTNAFKNAYDKWKYPKN